MSTQIPQFRSNRRATVKRLYKVDITFHFAELGIDEEFTTSGCSYFVPATTESRAKFIALKHFNDWGIVDSVTVDDFGTALIRPVEKISNTEINDYLRQYDYLLI